MTKYSADDILKELNEKQLITDDKLEQLSEVIISNQSEQELPIYQKVLLGIGAFIASILLLLFLAIADIFTKNSMNCIILGSVFIGGALGFYRLSFQKKDNYVANSFFMQFSFASMMIGKIIFTAGITLLFDSDSEWAITLALLLVTVATYHIYKVSIDRFVSSLATLISILVSIASNFDNSELLINGLFLFQFIGSAFMLIYHKIKREYTPISYAFVFSLCATVFYLSSYARISGEDINIVVINIVLAIGLIALFILASGGVKKLEKEPLVVASIFAILLGGISAPGILLAITLLVLGYYKYEKRIIGLGIFMLIVFLIFYYYNLDVSLMQKSMVLIGSGILLLLGRLYVKFKYIK